MYFLRCLSRLIFSLLADIISVLSPSTFTEDNLGEQFHSDIECTSPLEQHQMQNCEDELIVSY